MPPLPPPPLHSQSGQGTAGPSWSEAWPQWSRLPGPLLSTRPAPTLHCSNPATQGFFQPLKQAKSLLSKERSSLHLGIPSATSQPPPERSRHARAAAMPPPPRHPQTPTPAPPSSCLLPSLFTHTPSSHPSCGSPRGREAALPAQGLAPSGRPTEAPVAAVAGPCGGTGSQRSPERRCSAAGDRTSGDPPEISRKMSHLGNFKNVRISRFYTKIYTQDRRSGRGAEIRDCRLRPQTARRLRRV